MKHFVLVHGLGDGAWCWYKLVPLLKLAGHRVTALDLGASGVNPNRLHEIASIFDYVQPLMDLMASLPQDERVILVGHSFGGFVISLAMEKFPEKVLVAIFVTAYMPNCIDPLATLAQEFIKWIPMDSLLDCQMSQEENQLISVSFGPNYMETMVYPNCTQEDLELAKMLVRPTGMYTEDFAQESVLTEAKFGSVSWVYVVCGEDRVMKEGFQRWMIENSPTKDVKYISKADHMVMLSKTKELSQCLQEVAERY